MNEGKMTYEVPECLTGLARAKAEGIGIKRALNTLANPNIVYLDLVRDIVTCGVKVKTAGETCTRIHATPYVFDRAPLISVRKTAWKTALREWEWFMSGRNDLKSLHPSVHPWWNAWANERGVVRFNYGEQFRRLTSPHQALGWFDQIQWFIDSIRNHPFSRRTVISTWYLPEMVHPMCKITNCHGTMIQAFVDPSVSGMPNILHIVMYQRSCDTICGVPHNWIQYWAFLLWLCHLTGLKPGTFTWIGGDTHIYEKHNDIVDKLIDMRANSERVPIPVPPGLVYNPSTNGVFRADDFSLDGPYEPVLTDRAEMIVGTSANTSTSGHRS